MTSLRAILDSSRTPRTSMWGPVLAERELVCIYGAAGVGKTEFVLSLVHALLAGLPFLRWPCPRPRRVKYLDPEMGKDRFADRLQRIVDYYEAEIADDALDVTFPEQFGDRAYPNLFSDAGKEFIFSESKGRDLLVLDGWLNIDRPVTRFDDDETRWQKNFPFLKKLTRYGTSVLIVHHANKSGSFYGTSQLRNGVDCMIELAALPKVDEALRVAVRFDKTRHFGFPDSETLAVTRHPSGQWEWETLKSYQATKVYDLSSRGLKPKQIAEALGLSLSEVQAALAADAPAKPAGTGFTHKYDAEDLF